MFPLTTTIRGLAGIVAAVAVCAFACFRLDLPALPLGIIWHATECQLGMNSPAYVVTTWLAYWVLPLLGILLVRSPTTSRSTWTGIWVIGLCFLAWLALRRVAPIGIGYIPIWPDSHWGILKEACVGRRPIADCPRLPRFWPLFYSQKGDLLSLLTFAILFVMKYRRVLPQRALAIGAMAINSWKTVEWCCLIWYVRQWDTGGDKLVGGSGYAAAFTTEFEVLPPITWVDWAGGATICIGFTYFVWVIFRSIAPKFAHHTVIADAKADRRKMD